MNEDRKPEEEMPGNAIAGCLFCAAIMFGLVLFYFVIKFVDHCCRQEAPDFSPTPAAASKGIEE